MSAHYAKSFLPQGPCMARCTTGPRPQRKLSNPPFLCLHERLAGREAERQSAIVVVNATLAMHGILTSLPLPQPSALHNRQSHLLWQKVGLHFGPLLDEQVAFFLMSALSE